MKTPLTFTAAGPVYAFVPGVKASDIVDQLNARQVQLEALLSMTYGQEGDAFRSMSDILQNNFMWACSMIAREIQELTEALQDRQARRLIASRQSGALAFRATLLALMAQHRAGIKEGKDYQPTVFVPALRQAFDAHLQGDASVGFWDAFGAWLSQTLEGCEIDLDSWDVLRDLEIEEGQP